MKKLKHKTYKSKNKTKQNKINIERKEKLK
jgi:hypothetical protein